MIKATPLERSKVVINLSQRPLVTNEEEVLALGLNFALSPRSIPTISIIASTESVARQRDPIAAEQLRSGVSEALNHSKTPKPNLSNCIRKALYELKIDQSIVILPANKR